MQRRVTQRSAVRARSGISLLGVMAVLASPAVFGQAEVSSSVPPQAAATPAGEAIIPDDEFDKAIPPIDADPDAPMGSVADWEAQAAAADQALPEPPALDPEIDRPLTPLQSFDVEPFDESRYTEADDSRQSEVRYSYRIEGLESLSQSGEDGISPIHGEGVRALFRSLSALEEGKGKAANGAMINARLQADQMLLTDILTGQGYFDATVLGSLDLPEQGDAQAPQDGIVVRLDAAPGPRYRLGAIRFDAPPVTPPDLIVKSFVPKTGEPIVADRILSAEANIAVRLPEKAYPFAVVGDRDILLDAESRTGDYTLPITPGPRSSFGDIVIAGPRPVFDAGHIATIARFSKGELYDSRKVDDLRKALVATGLFSVVSISPQQSGMASGEDSQYATLVVNQEAGPKRTLAGQAGYATGQGIKLEGSWTHRNLFPPEGALIGSAIAGTQEQGLGVTFRRSNAGRRDRSVEFGASINHTDTEAYEAYTGRLAGRVSYNGTPIWQKRLTYSYGFELLGTNEQDYDFDAGEKRRRTFSVLALPGQVTFDTSNSLLDPTRGFRLTAKLSPEASLGSGAQGYARLLFESTGYYGVSDGIVLAGRARVGMIQGARREQIAPSRRYYAGGGGSVRGFGYQELGPKDPDNNPIGGRSLVEAAAEVRYRFGDYGVVGFIDGGQVYTSSLPHFTDWRFGVGLGGRFYTNFGPMRLDVATPIGRKPGESRISIYISIGQAF